MNRLLVLLPLLAAACNGQFLLSPAHLGVPVLTHSVASPILSGHIISNPLVRNVAVSPVVNSVAVSPVAVPISSQYHAQDELGQFAFGHSTANQAREEVKSFDGTVRGAYSYVDPTGKLNNVQYLADSNGFRVIGANNLPIAPEAVLEPVKDTPEVVEARANFARAFKEAQEAAAKPEAGEKAEEAKSRRRRQVYLTPLISTLSAKTILKTSELKPIEDAKVPASTKLAEVKEVEKEILTPLTYSSHLLAPSVVSSHPLTPSVVSSQLLTPSVVSPLLASPIVATRTVLPAVAKTTVTTSELKPIDDAKTPAATKLAEIKEEKKDILTPIPYSLISSPYLTSHIIPSPYLTSHVVAAPVVSGRLLI